MRRCAWRFKANSRPCGREWGLQHQARDGRRQQAHQRRAVNQLQAKTGHHVALLLVQSFDGAGDDADGGEVGERHQEHRQNAQPARRQLRRDLLQFNHRHEFVGYQFGRHDAARLQGFFRRDADQPGQRIEHVAEDLLEADAEHRREQRIDGGDQRDKADQHRRDDHRNLEAGQNVLAQHFEEALIFMQFVQLQLRLVFNLIRVDDRQDDEGAEHIKDQRRHHVLRVDHRHVGADDGERNRRHGGRGHGVHAARRDIADDAFIGDKVLRLPQHQRADGVERFQLAHAVDLGQQGADQADDQRQDAEMLQNADQGGNKDDRAQNAEEDERQTILAHAAEHELRSLGCVGEQGVEEAGDVFDHAEPAGGVQEEIGQRAFDHQQLDDIAQADFLAIIADQQRQGDDHHQGHNKLQNLWHKRSVRFTGRKKTHLATASPSFHYLA